MGKIKLKVLLHKIKELRKNGFHGRRKPALPLQKPSISPYRKPSLPNSSNVDKSGLCFSPLNHKAVDITFPLSPAPPCRISPRQNIVLLNSPQPAICGTRASIRKSKADATSAGVVNNQPSVLSDCAWNATLSSSFRKAKESLQAFSTSINKSDDLEKLLSKKCRKTLRRQDSFRSSDSFAQKDTLKCCGTSSIMSKDFHGVPSSKCIKPAQRSLSSCSTSLMDSSCARDKEYYNSFSSDDNLFTSERGQASNSSSSEWLERGLFSGSRSKSMRFKQRDDDEDSVYYPWLSPEISSSCSKTCNLDSLDIIVDRLSKSQRFERAPSKTGRKKVATEDSFHTEKQPEIRRTPVRKKGRSRSRRKASSVEVIDHHCLPANVKGKVKGSLAVVKCSRDPYLDFRDSMVDMVLEKQMFETRDLEELLHCFLKLNSSEHHETIVSAFTEVWQMMLGIDHAENPVS